MPGSEYQAARSKWATRDRETLSCHVYYNLPWIYRTVDVMPWKGTVFQDSKSVSLVSGAFFPFSLDFFSQAFAPERVPCSADRHLCPVDGSTVVSFKRSTAFRSCREREKILQCQLSLETALARASLALRLSWRIAIDCCAGSFHASRWSSLSIAATTFLCESGIMIKDRTSWQD